MHLCVTYSRWASAVLGLTLFLNDRYIVRDMLGQGTFGQVVRCLREDTREEVAVKVIKNQTAFYHQVSRGIRGRLIPFGRF